MYIDNVTYSHVEEKAPQYEVTIRQIEHGTVIADKEMAAEGEEVTLTIIPEQGYALTSIQLTNSVFFTQSTFLDVEKGPHL